MRRGRAVPPRTGGGIGAAGNASVATGGEALPAGAEGLATGGRLCGDAGGSASTGKPAGAAAGPLPRPLVLPKNRPPPGFSPNGKGERSGPGGGGGGPTAPSKAA